MHLCLSNPFDDVRGKYLKEQADNTALTQEIHILKEKLKVELSKAYDDNLNTQAENRVLVEENEVLKETLGKGFEAYDDKYKETEKLKKELALKEREAADNDNDGTSDQDMTNQKEGAAASPTTISQEDTHNVEQKPPVTFKSTQTDEEKRDEVAMTSVNYKDLLNSCGLEVVLQADKVFLILINRDDLKLWLENETDGKVSVSFEKIPVCERFIQTDDVTIISQDNVHKDQQLNQAIIIQLKSKIYDQANIIKKYRQIMSQQLNKSLAASVQTESSENVEATKKLFNRYHQSFLAHSQVVVNHMASLRKQLEFQQKYSKHLLDVIKGTKTLPKQFMLISNVAQAKLKDHGQREIKKPPPSFPVVEQHAEDCVSDENSPDGEPSGDFSTSGHLSIAVQESDTHPRANDCDPSIEEESSASVVTITESRSSSSEQSGIPPTQAQGSSTTVKKTSTSAVTLSDFKRHSSNERSRSNSSERFGMPFLQSEGDQTSSSAAAIPAVRPSDVEQPAMARHDNDDIIIISEDDVAIGGAPGISIGAKECPVCYISYSPASSQEEFEGHVLGHFQD
ncbi:hypothetical protein QZH41_015718 [Actinostola sp. cb2023]|nr:hypothetical protein QZH41_015718 [Actinostola sp. cb2023]